MGLIDYDLELRNMDRMILINHAGNVPAFEPFNAPMSPPAIDRGSPQPLREPEDTLENAMVMAVYAVVREYDMFVCGMFNILSFFLLCKCLMCIYFFCFIYKYRGHGS